MATSLIKETQKVKPCDLDVVMFVCGERSDLLVKHNY